MKDNENINIIKIKAICVKRLHNLVTNKSLIVIVLFFSFLAAKTPHVLF